jgi:hypothetical protein
MTRWCKLVALAVGTSGLVGATAPAQDAPPAPSRWSLFRRDKTPAPPDAPAPDGPVAAAPDDAEIAVPPFPVMGPPPPAQPGAPPLAAPFSQPLVPPAVAPPGPDRPPNGFSDPIPPDAENAFECNPQPECVPCHPFYVGVDYLHWWLQKQPMQALVTTGSISDNVPGAFGQPGTKIFIDDVSRHGDHDGVRVMFGYDFDPQGVLGAEISGFWLDRTSPSAVARGDGSANSRVLTRPFFNVITGQQDADPINVPGVMAGQFVATAQSQLYGANADVRWLVNAGSVYGPHFTLLGGFAFLELDEKLLVSENLHDVPGLGAPGNHYVLGENFTTYNHFYGGEAGAAADCHVGPVVLIFVGKCAFGRTEEVERISGFTTVTQANGTVTTNPQAALLVGPGNVGRHSNGQWAVVPQGQFKLAYQFNQYVRMNLGYDALWIDRVIRPGNALNTNVNVQPVGGPPVAPLQPTVEPFRSSGLWAQGFSIGVEVNF